MKQTALFCMCLHHPLYTEVSHSACLQHIHAVSLSLQHCDKVVAQCYPQLADKGKATFYNPVAIKSDKVTLVTAAKQVVMDRAMVRGLHVSRDFGALECHTSCVQILMQEIDHPLLLELKPEDLADYPPRISISLSPPEEGSFSTELRVMGLKTECCFTITNESELQL